MNHLELDNASTRAQVSVRPRLSVHDPWAQSRLPIYNRKNALLADSNGGEENWAILASLIETCKPSRVNPQAYLADVLAKIVNGYLNDQIDDLLPWVCADKHEPL
jgi:hypothetical protein